MDRASVTAQALARQGRVEDAYATLTQAAAAGDGEACYTLGAWRLSGALIRRDLAAARDWYGRAAALGWRAGRGPYLALLANGVGGAAPAWQEALAGLWADAAADPAARRECGVLEAMALTATGDPAAPLPSRQIGTGPDVTLFPAFLSPAECAWLAERAEPRLEPAVIVDPATGAMRRDPMRTARSAAFPFVAESPALHALNRRIAAATGTDWAQGEPLQVLSYGRGDEYRPHSDALPGADNQRVLTLLAYLNDNFGGGETHFLNSGLKFKGRPGDAILFGNVTADGRLDPAARHAGLPVRAGTKLLLSKWLRARPLDLSGPPGRPC